jgi:hypothetical protein
MNTCKFFACVKLSLDVDGNESFDVSVKKIQDTGNIKSVNTYIEKS